MKQSTMITPSAPSSRSILIQWKSCSCFAATQSSSRKKDKMEDWEDEPIPSLRKKDVKESWEDEDVDDNDTKESWEDEDEHAQVPAVEPPSEEAPKKTVAEGFGKKGKIVEVVKEAPLEKLGQQRLSKSNDEKTLDNLIPKSEDDFLEYAELISHKLRPHEKKFHYIGLLKTVMRLSMTSLKASDAKEVASCITAISNEKLKAEKEANAGKKKKTEKKKKQLHIENNDDDIVLDSYAGADDYDFI